MGLTWLAWRLNGNVTGEVRTAVGTRHAGRTRYHSYEKTRPSRTISKSFGTSSKLDEIRKFLDSEIREKFWKNFVCMVGANGTL
jgi:hypothetical protein